MNKDELREVVDFANGAWNRDVFGNALKTQLKSWWHFLGDLDAEEVKNTLSTLSLTARYFPRPGEVRVRVKMGALEDPYEAWADAQVLIQSVQSGTTTTRGLSLTTRAVLRRLGDIWKGMATNGDREMFVSVYRKVQNDEIEAVCDTSAPV